MKASTMTTSTELEDRAILVSLVTGDETDDLVRYSMEELVRLAETAGVEVLDTAVQKREKADSKWFIGKGKVEEVRDRLRELNGTTVIFNQELSGGQVRNLEEYLDAKIVDRTQLILDIFAQRAKTREGILQVELAQLSYLLPRLSGHGKNLSRLGGGIGTRGPGETKLETDRRHIRNRITDLRRQLDEVTRHRKLHRERRKKSGVYQVALVGYTNAGKSTLLNRMTKSDVYAENKLFATLDPTSRSMPLPSVGEVVLTDTVGFIQQLPHDLVAAFRATLEEVLEADLILHVVDASSSMREEHIRVVDGVLEELGAQGKETVMIYNKIDLCTPGEREMIPTGENTLAISAMNDDHLEALKDVLERRLMGEVVTMRFPIERGDLIALAYRVSDVMESETEEEAVVLTAKLQSKAFALSASRLEPYIVK
ncbi:GTPase HflX [Paenibacillus antri]|uniref:GTPase HflX n=1 Tax=Paenibacillus antri TaxID=2582848 RepID=A0A5R9GAL2_9BACL|nr:GTPase HflX [Paenibacillus antri]TLS50144.1 GTPase HflX [Paenibacillus antri]